MPVKREDYELRTARLVLRALMLVISVLALTWSATTGVRAVRGAALTDIAERILAGHQMSPITLDDVLRLERGDACPPAAKAEALTIMSFALTRHVLAFEIFADQQLADVEQRAAGALACAPHRPLLWYLLFWSRTLRSGSPVDHLPLLRMSYRLGPHEGWLQALRSPFVMSFVEELPPEDQTIVIAEFGALLKAGLLPAAAQAFANAPSQAQARLLSAVERLPGEDRQRFSRALQKFDLSVEISGVKDPEREQWDPFLQNLDAIRSLLHEPRGNR